MNFFLNFFKKKKIKTTKLLFLTERFSDIHVYDRAKRLSFVVTGEETEPPRKSFCFTLDNKFPYKLIAEKVNSSWNAVTIHHNKVIHTSSDPIKKCPICNTEMLSTCFPLFKYKEEILRLLFEHPSVRLRLLLEKEN